MLTAQMWLSYRVPKSHTRKFGHIKIDVGFNSHNPNNWNKIVGVGGVMSDGAESPSRHFSTMFITINECFVP